MNIKNISDRVIYCGVNDRTTDLFEGLWDLPLGVSYNSYIVKGSEASAIIDASDSGHAPEYLRHIEDTLDGRNPDYLVINHIEPDHSGVLPMLLDRYPDLQIVGNAKTVDMLKGFYGVESNIKVMAEGEMLSLGDRTLQFIMTPMVHWPETMFTYLQEEGILFTGDAFGCFGALNGAVIDDDMMVEHYFREAYRYYGCIVAKYGTFVEKAFAKIAHLTVNYLCTTHGPVWHSRREEIGGQYARMARWEGDAGVVVAYGSMYGNTTAMAEEIASNLAARGVKDIVMFDVSRTPLSHVLGEVMRLKGLVLVSPTYNSEIYPPVAHLADALVARGVKNRVIGIAGSYAWGSQSVRKLVAKFDGKPVDVIAPTAEMKQAQMPAVADALSEMAAVMASRL
ncbi:MAG: FprA family A-type flavoprotein [Candidatus Amulumruptor sp.]